MGRRERARTVGYSLGQEHVLGIAIDLSGMEVSASKLMCELGRFLWVGEDEDWVRAFNIEEGN